MDESRIIRILMTLILQIWVSSPRKYRIRLRHLAIVGSFHTQKTEETRLYSLERMTEHDL